jgi:hypothetical protein
MSAVVLTRHCPQCLTYLVKPVPWQATTCPRCGWIWS